VVELPVNAFKRGLTSGVPQIGLWATLGNANCAELCAGAGFDWLLIDSEHGTTEVVDVLDQLRATQGSPTATVVRPPCGDATLIKRYLDIGAQTLMIPMVETAAQARDIVAAMRYAPQGVRGVAAITRAARWTRVKNYLRTAQQELCLITQIESARALENLEAIAAVEGVDALFIGPADLAATMGHLGDSAHSDVMAAVEKGIARACAAGKPVGLLTVDEKTARRYLELGAQFVAVGVDVTLLARATDELRAKFKP
jgi:4-hydroxy-2-oxoheptanedioate aldolase